MINAKTEYNRCLMPSLAVTGQGGMIVIPEKRKMKGGLQKTEENKDVEFNKEETLTALREKAEEYEKKKKITTTNPVQKHVRDEEDTENEEKEPKLKKRKMETTKEEYMPKMIGPPQERKKDRSKENRTEQNRQERRIASKRKRKKN